MAEGARVNQQPSPVHNNNNNNNNNYNKVWIVHEQETQLLSHWVSSSLANHDG
jgi:hypothetical protein